MKILNLYLLILTLAFTFVRPSFADNPAGPVTSGDPTSPLLNDDANKGSMWQNMFQYYKKLKQNVMKYVDAVNGFGDLCYGAYVMYKKWEAVTKRIDILVHTNPFTGNNLSDQVINAETWFRESDDILYRQIPDAEKTQANLGTQYNAWVKSISGSGDVDQSGPNDVGEKVRTAYLQNRGLTKTVDPNGRVLQGFLDSVYQATVTTNANTYGNLIQIDRTAQQEAAAGDATAQDAWGLLTCQDTTNCGGIAQKADLENRLGMLHNREVRVANQVALAATTANMSEILNQINIWTIQGNVGTILLNGSRIAYSKFCKQNNIEPDPAITPQVLNGMYPRAYHYDGRIYSSDGVLQYAPN